ncbi:MAG: hypothetical protein ACOY0T_28965 [Myxococcota bacterium]
MLTQRAQQYLATLKRGPSVPLEDIKRWFAESGQPCFDVWLDFHERYAGLEEPSTGYALGLAQPVDASNPAHAPRIECSESGQRCVILIAAVEDFEELKLDWRGKVTINAERAETFDLKVERDALRWEFQQSGRTVRLTDDDFCQSLLPQLENDWVAEASDEYVHCYRNARYLLFVNARTRYVDEARERVDAVRISYSGSGRRKPAPPPPRPGFDSAFLPVSIFRPQPLSGDPYRRLVERLSLLGNLAIWDPPSVARALDVELLPQAYDPSSPERRYVATNSDVFEKIVFDVPTHRSHDDLTFSLTPHGLYATEPNTALTPLLPRDSRAELAWPQKQAGKTPKHHARAVTIGETELHFDFDGDDFTGPQRLTYVYIKRPNKAVSSTRFGVENYRVEALGGTEYSIRRLDDGTESVRVVDITEDPREPDRVSISFRALDYQLTIQDHSRLITMLIVQGVRRDRYLGRVEHLDYKELDTDLEYTRLWNQQKKSS